MKRLAPMVGVCAAAVAHAHVGSGAASVGTTGWTWVVIGVEHILTGLDHLAFLLGLMFAARSLREACVLSLVFAVGHSLTLAASTLGWLAVDHPAIEVVIALSVVWTGWTVLIARDAKERTVVCGLLGLVHGLGFASVLADLPQDGVGTIWRWLGFNVGVELGQLLALALCLPTVILTRESRWSGPVRHGVAGGLMCLGLAWVVQRSGLV